MMYPLVRELAGDGVPVTVTCRVLKLARQPYYRWLACPVTEAELVEAYRANALVDAHRDDPDIPVEDTLGGFDELVRAGKIRHVGLSNYSAERLSTALTLADRHALARPVALQPHYNLVERAAYEDDLAEVASLLPAAA